MSCRPVSHMRQSAMISGSKLDPARRSIVIVLRRALRWSVDGFFERILPQAIRDDVLIIYTSDHGQALFDGGYDTQHCSLGTRIADGEFLRSSVCDHRIEAIPGRSSARSRSFVQPGQPFRNLSHAALGHGLRFPVVSAEVRGLFNVPHDGSVGFLRWCASAAISVHVLAYYECEEGYTQEFAWPRAISPAASCTRRNGPRTSTTPASAWW